MTSYIAACYLDNPKAFNKRLLKFVNRAEGLKGLRVRKVEKDKLPLA